MREHVRAARLVGRYVWRADPKRAVLAVLVSVGSSLVDMTGALLLKMLVDEAATGDTAGIVLAAVLLGGTLLGAILGHWASLTVGMALRERATLYFDSEMARLCAGISTIEHHERPDYLDQLQLLHQNHQRLAAAHESAVATLSTVARLGFTVVLLGSVHPALLALPLFGLPSLWAHWRGDRLRRATYERLAHRRRLDVKLFSLATSRQAGMEVRLYGIGDDLLNGFDAAVREADAVEDAFERRFALLTGAGWLFFGLGFVSALLLVAREAIEGRASAGDVVLAVALASQVNYGVSGLAGSLSWLLSNLDIGRRLVWLEDLASDAAKQASPPEPAPVPAALADGIRFEHVSFRYPGTETTVLEDVDLFLPAGSTVAVVGDNGAGKTTLVKLLCRFYDPTAGTITVDGVDLRRLDAWEWRARLAGCFQDFARLELVTREVVGVGHLEDVEDPQAVTAALERASATDVPAGFPDGLETLLGRSFDGGVEPSTGQWQKLALGRAMMRERPVLLVLDEPTASLDAPTEHALFERYTAAASDAAHRAGAVTVLVSHRMSTVRMADLIVVLQDGRIAEIGSHEDLVAAGGSYAELYALQARAYR